MLEEEVELSIEAPPLGSLVTVPAGERVMCRVVMQLILTNSPNFNNLLEALQRERMRPLRGIVGPHWRSSAARENAAVAWWMEIL